MIRIDLAQDEIRNGEHLRGRAQWTSEGKDARKLRRFIEQARSAGSQEGGDHWVPDPDAAPYDWMADGA